MREGTSLEEEIGLLEDLIAEPGPGTPEAIIDLAGRPDLDPYWAQPLYEAFWFLSLSRPLGFAPGAIPLAEMVHYCEIFEVEDVREFVRHIRDLDEAFLAHAIDKPSSPPSHSSPSV